MGGRVAVAGMVSVTCTVLLEPAFTVTGFASLNEIDAPGLTTTAGSPIAYA
jgi:hypothetical protein